MTFTPDEKRAIAVAADIASAYRSGLADAPVSPELRPDAFAAGFSTALPDTGSAADAVIADLVAQAMPGLHAFSSPKFFGYVCGGSMPTGVAADMLVSAWGQNSASSWESPAIAVIEQTLCQWALELMDLPRGSGVGLVSGATVANTQAIMAARHALLARQGWDVEEDGLWGAPAFPVLVGADCHAAPIAGLSYAGLGKGRAIRVATDSEGRVDVSAMAKALEDCAAPPLVILQAGQINSGAFDVFDQIIPMVHAKGGWVHVDGAFGLWVRAVPDLRHRLAGVEQADSWAVDLHKWLSAPYDAALCIVSDRAALVQSMSVRGAYLPDVQGTWEPSDSTLELSRRARGVPSYAILRHLGREGVIALVAGHCALAKHVADRLHNAPGFDVLNDVVCNQVAIACDTDDLTKAVLNQVHERAKVYPSHGEWQGRQIIRVSISNYATSEADVDLLVDELIAAHGALA